jgi:hypothetical protein
VGSLAVAVAVIALGSVVGGVATMLQHDGEPESAAAALAAVEVDSVKEYDETLDPLRKRSDRLEERFAFVQGKGYSGQGKVRDVLEEIVPEYAELIARAGSIEVRGKALGKAHERLLASLEEQQRGLELALKGLVEDDTLLVARAGAKLDHAQELLEEHRRLLESARR